VHGVCIHHVQEQKEADREVHLQKEVSPVVGEFE
jgi:hypothetical protein